MDNENMDTANHASASKAGANTPPSGGGGAIYSKDDCIQHYEWGNGCQGWTFVDTDALSVKQELMPPSASEQLHYHAKATQFFFILKGSAIFYVDGQIKILTEHQGIEIHPGQQHRISNHSEADLEFMLYSHPSTKHDRVNVETP
jgi:mannose-6-phosphate isomerase-like protein (cupin superfamily)